MCIDLSDMAHTWRTEDNLQNFVLSFDHLGTRDHTWVLRLSGRHLYLLNQCYGPYHHICRKQKCGINLLFMKTYEFL